MSPGDAGGNRHRVRYTAEEQPSGELVWEASCTADGCPWGSDRVTGGAGSYHIPNELVSLARSHVGV